jgi:hypothetical protein
LTAISPPPIVRAPSREPVAQSVEHLTFNQGVMGSIPIGLTRDNKPLISAH